MPSSGRGPGSYCCARPHKTKTKRRSKTAQRRNQRVPSDFMEVTPNSNDAYFDLMFLGRIKTTDGGYVSLNDINGTIHDKNGKEIVPVINREPYRPIPDVVYDVALEEIEKSCNNQEWTPEQREKALDALQRICDTSGCPQAYPEIQKARQWLKDNHDALVEQMKRFKKKK